MWRWCLNLSRARRARRAAAAMIVPLVEASRARLGGISEATWSEPYIIGFTAMLITLISRIEVGRLDDNALGAVQTGAWQDVTGLRTSVVGEDIVLLGAARNRSFEAGCRDAATFGTMLVARSVLFAGADKAWQTASSDPGVTPPAARDDVSAAWQQFFDAHVVRGSGDIAPAPETDPDDVLRWL
jgi:hypothetical protein